MATTYEPAHLSATPNGKAIRILPSSGFVTIHTSPTSPNVYDEVYINLYCLSSSATGIASVRLNTTNPDETMQFHLVSGTVTPILRGHRLSGGAYVAIENTSASILICFGSVNRITIN